MFWCPNDSIRCLALTHFHAEAAGKALTRTFDVGIFGTMINHIRTYVVDFSRFDVNESVGSLRTEESCLYRIVGVIDDV